jgi:hypothetical protein
MFRSRLFSAARPRDFLQTPARFESCRAALGLRRRDRVNGSLFQAFFHEDSAHHARDVVAKIDPKPEPDFGQPSGSS